MSDKANWYNWRTGDKASVYQTRKLGPLYLVHAIQPDGRSWQIQLDALGMSIMFSFKRFRR
jgi:hypothetical protein